MVQGGVQVLKSASPGPTSLHDSQCPDWQPSAFEHGKPGNPGRHTSVRVCGKVVVMQLNPGTHSRTIVPSGVFRRTQSGEQASGGLAEAGKRYGMHDEP